MKWRSVIEKSIVALIGVSICSGSALGQSTPGDITKGQRGPVETLNQYLRLRFRGADWNEYSRFIDMA